MAKKKPPRKNNIPLLGNVSSEQLIEMSDRIKRTQIELLRKADEFKAWWRSLAEIDRTNLQALLNMPNARDLIPQCPDEQSRKMMMFALEVKEAREQILKGK